MIKFQINDPSLESQWRAIILFGKNSATYKFAFAKTLLDFVDEERTAVTLKDLAIPFAQNLIEHLQNNDKQGNSTSSKFLETCRKKIQGEISDSKLFEVTEQLGFVNVIEAFQIVNNSNIPNQFYEKNFKAGKKEIVFTDHLLRLKESFHFQNFNQEVEARWRLVETAWNQKINPSILEVRYDENKSIFFMENNLMRRVDITSVRDSLNGYQKGKCFYSFQEISINTNSTSICQVDHFLPHINKLTHIKDGTNINGVWNLVLAESSINLDKGSKVPELRFLERLFSRNEYYIESRHPLAETIINQTGHTKDQRRKFLQRQYNLALYNSIHTWKPKIEITGTF